MKHSLRIQLEKRKDKEGNLITENVPIMAAVTFGGQRFFYFTGFRIDAKSFDPGAQRVRKNNFGKEGSQQVQYNVMNARFDAISAALTLHFQSHREVTKAEAILLLDEVCKKKHAKESNTVQDGSFFSMFERYIDTQVSKSKRLHVVSVMNHWKRFNPDADFIVITADTLTKFEDFLKDGRGRNTVASIVKTTRSFWNWAKKVLKSKGIELSYPFKDSGYEMPSESYGTPIYITIEERELLFNAKIPSKRLEQVRDIFVFQCFVGMRVGDLCKLTKDNIQNGMLSYIAGKTKDERPITATIPLHPKAIAILEKYKMPGNMLLPFISDQRYNVYLKEVFAFVGITRIVTRLNPRTNEPEQVRLCDIASSHMARRAFVGNLYGKVDSGIIQSMTGHIPGSKAFARYHGVSPELQQHAINLL